MHVALALRTPHHHRQAELVEPAHRILAHTLPRQDQPVGGLRRRGELLRDAARQGRGHGSSMVRSLVGFISTITAIVWLRSDS